MQRHLPHQTALLLLAAVLLIGLRATLRSPSGAPERPVAAPRPDLPKEYGIPDRSVRQRDPKLTVTHGSENSWYGASVRSIDLHVPLR